MVSVGIRELSLALPPFRLSDVTLQVPAGEYFVLLGPTGAGKSVLLECIAGLLQPDRGRIFLGDRDVTALPPEKRGVGFLPQDYALFPNMTVERNISFGLRVRRLPADLIRRRVGELTEQLGIGHLLTRMPLKLSGGEKQRVGLARALAVEPDLLLLDEPLAAVDERSRDRIAADLREVQRQSGVTVVHVSHNFEETFAVADRIGVVIDGRLEQVGSPEDVFDRPRNLSVARFTRAENVFPVIDRERRDEGTLLCTLEEGISLLAAAKDGPAPTHAMVRPEHIDLLPPGQKVKRDGFHEVEVTVQRLIPRGALTSLECHTDLGTEWTVLLPSRAAGKWTEGERARLVFAPEDVHFPGA